MTANLLHTKLFIPEPRQDYIPRPRLLEMLDGSLARKLTLVAAPPGYGKSTLISIWIEERQHPTAWLTLDPQDNDGFLFIRYLIAALDTIFPAIGQVSLALLKSTERSTPTSILTALLNELSQLGQPTMLVLDDYHHIENQEIHEYVTFLLDHLPPDLHLVLASRSDPPLPLSRLRARNQLLEIRQADLRLSITETEQFLQQSMGLDLSAMQISQLDARTEGWLAGLQFAGLSMHQQTDKGAFLEAFSGSHRYVIDYLADEVLSNQTEEMQKFLGKIALLDRFTAPLCDAITGLKDSQSLIIDLEENNLFLINLDEERIWFRFHHLFLDYLRTQSDSQQQIRLHKIAAQWLLDNHIFPEAVKHASASQDKELLVHAITGAAQSALEAGEIDYLATWLKSIPAQELMANSQLATYMGMITFFSVNPESAVPFMEAAVKNLPPTANSSLQGQLMCLQAHVSLYQGDLNRSIHLSREALEYLDPDDLFFRNLTLNVLGQILEMRGDVIGAVEVYRQAFISSQAADDQLGTLVIFTNLIFALNELGERNQAMLFCEEFLADPKWSSLTGWSLSDGIYLPWSLLSYEANQLDQAMDQITRALQGLELVNVAQGKLWALFIQGSLLLANKEYAHLAELTDQGRQLARRSGSNTVHYGWFELLDAQAALDQGDLATADVWARSKNFSPTDSPLHWFEGQYFAYLRLLIKQGNLEDARQLLETMQANVQAGKRFRKLITIHLLFALVEAKSERDQESKFHLTQALQLAVPQDYHRAFLNEGQALLDLLPAVCDSYPDFVNRLLGEKSPVQDQGIDLPQPYENLSERELEVLRLVSRGYSNRQIAEALFVTLGTVKKHLNNVFGKLQVSNRTEAVARGRELHLLD